MAHPVIHHTKRILNKPRIVIPVVAGIALITALAVYLSLNTSKNYVTTPVALGNVSAALSTTGTIKAATQTSLAFPKGGRVSSVLVHVGQTVQEGQTLAGLDSADARGAVETAEGAYEAAQANYNRLLNGASDSDTTIAKINYDATVSEQALAVKTARQKLLSSDLVAISSSSSGTAIPTISGTYTGENTGTLTLSVYQGGSGSYWNASGIASGSGSVDTKNPQPIGTSGLFVLFPASNAAYASDWTIAVPNTNGPNYTANNAAYTAALQNQIDKVAQAKATLDKVQSAPRSEDVAQAEAQMKSAAGSLHTAQAAFANDFIVAPYSGTITSVSDSTAGSIVAANTPFIGIMSHGAFQIETYVSEKDLALVSVGKEVSIITDAYGPSVIFKGTVVEVAPAATTTPSGLTGYKVTYQFTESDPRIKPGISVTVDLQGGSRQNVLEVPRTAIFLKNGASFVLVKNGKKIEERPVTVGLVGTDTVEILSGLTSGEEVVTLGNN